jgi:pyruvate, water dikinase
MRNILDLFSKENSCRLLVNAEGKIAEKYEYYRQFLIHNHDALNIIAELELLYHGGGPFTMSSVKKRYTDLMETTGKLVYALDRLSGGKYAGLIDACDRIGRDTASIFRSAPPSHPDLLVLPFEAVTADMADLAGPKTTNLASIGNVLKLPVPEGFVVTAAAFNRFLEDNDLIRPIEDMLTELPSDSPADLDRVTAALQKRITQAPVPKPLAAQILKAYETLEAKTEKNVLIAMRSSAVGEDTQASFAGQYATALNVGRDSILDAYKTVLASKYSPRAILYRMRYGLDDQATPMCVAGITMIDAVASGVLYSINPSDPAGRRADELLVTAIWGLGEHLVSGEASPDVYFVDRKTQKILRKSIAVKQTRIVSQQRGGTRLEQIPESERHLPAIDDESVEQLAGYGLSLEAYFKEPQDVEWCMDQTGKLFLLQSRPLGVGRASMSPTPPEQKIPDHPVLLTRGATASGGTAVGKVFLATEHKVDAVTEDAILVAKTASPEYAKLVSKVRGMITNVGSVASHLASVAREFGVPAIVDTGHATSSLKHGAWITMVADTATVYEGKVPDIEESVRPPKRELATDPMSGRMRLVMDRISPLNLTDPKAPSFSPEGCKTVHDIIRYAHENVIKEMFGLAGHRSTDVTSVQMKANIPLALFFIDLGGGLKKNLTTCDEITSDAIDSVPMKAFWVGLTHPGISWSGTVGATAKNIMALMTSGPPPQLDSYAIVSDEYVNLSIKFGYHYANLDIICSENREQNYVTLQFAGGAGSYFGRSMRINFLSEVLQRLGFTLNITGDLLEASLQGYDMQSMVDILDQMGRLLASSRLLDLAIPSQTEVHRMTEDFFNGNYDFLGQTKSPLPNFYTPVGNWDTTIQKGRTLCVQDGAKWGDAFSCGLNIVLGKMTGGKYQQFLDSIQAYYYFPVAIAKEKKVADGTIRVSVKPEAGCLDRMGGLAFGIRNAGNYFILTVDALENTFALYEFINNRRVTQARIDTPIESGRWYTIAAQISGSHLNGYLDDDPLIEHTAERTLEGYVGLGTKADSTVYFDNLVVQQDDRKHPIAF